MRPRCHKSKYPAHTIAQTLNIFVTFIPRPNRFQFDFDCVALVFILSSWFVLSFATLWNDLGQSELISSALLFNRETSCPACRTTCPPVQQQDLSSCTTRSFLHDRRDVFLWDRKAFLVECGLGHVVLFQLIPFDLLACDSIPCCCIGFDSIQIDSTCFQT